MNTYILDALAVLAAKSTGTRVDIQMDVGVGDNVQQLGDVLCHCHAIQRPLVRLFVAEATQL